MKIYKFKAYSKARDGVQDRLITRFGLVRNYAVRMMERYYRLYGKTMSAFELSNHVAKKKKRNCYTARMVEGLPSQSVQECIGRVHKGLRNFFSYCKRKKAGKVADRVRPPRCRKASHNKSYTLLQAGYKIDGNHVVLQGRRYGFHKSQEIKGKVKRLTIKRDRCGDIWFIVLTEWSDAQTMPNTGNAVGLDFGLKTFLTRHDGVKIAMPLFHKRSMKGLAKAQKRLARKVKGSNNRRTYRLAVARLYRRIENLRNDWQWKVARSIVKEFDIICIEDLNLDGMKRLWGRKVSDYGFAEFVAKLEHLAKKSGKEVRKVDRWLASSQTCHKCGHKNPDTKNLNVREWVCPHCGTKHDRDVNAAMNILTAGTSADWRGSSKTKNSIEELVA
jgi:putative transposase